MNKTNAMQREIAKLAEQWQEFADGDQAILHWLIKSSDLPIAQTFIKIKEQFDEENPEFFIQLTAPFSNMQEFGNDLAEELNQLITEGLVDADGGETKDWQAPDIRHAKSGFHALFMSCDLILKIFGDEVESLVLVIAPQAVKNPVEYQQWWAWACKIKQEYREWHPKLRLVVLDKAEQPFLSGTFAEQRTCVASRQPPLNMQAAMKEIAQEADDGSDGAKLRLHLLDMNKAIGEGDKNLLDQSAKLALPLAEKNQWFDVWTTLLMTRAAGWLNFRHFEAAMKDYRQAQVVAGQGLEKNVPGCDKLLLQSLLCEGTTYFLADYLPQAAAAYQKAALKAEELQDSWICLEAWRMASFCMERLDDRQQAWQLGNKAFAIGKKMEPEQRAQSTLPFVGQALLRISPNQQVKAEVQNVFTQWLGDDWLSKLESAVA